MIARLLVPGHRGDAAGHAGHQRELAARRAAAPRARCDAGVRWWTIPSISSRSGPGRGCFGVVSTTGSSPRARWKLTMLQLRVL